MAWTMRGKSCQFPGYSPGTHQLSHVINAPHRCAERAERVENASRTSRTCPGGCTNSLRLPTARKCSAYTVRFVILTSMVDRSLLAKTHQTRFRRAGRRSSALGASNAANTPRWRRRRGNRDEDGCEGIDHSVRTHHARTHARESVLTQFCPLPNSSMLRTVKIMARRREMAAAK